MSTLEYDSNQLRAGTPNTEAKCSPMDTQRDITRSYHPTVSDPADSVPTDIGQLRSQHPELDWDDADGAAETLAILSDPEAVAELEEAEHDIATGNLVPLDRYAPPS